MAGRLPPNMARNHSRCVCFCFYFMCFAENFTGLTIVHFCKSHINYSCMLIRLNRDAVATDIVHQHSGRLDYYKGFVKQASLRRYAECLSLRNFTQFYSTKSERDRNLRKEYDTQMEYRKHLQAFIDRWRYNANRGMIRRFSLWIYT